MNFKNPKKGKQKIAIVNHKQRRQIAVLASETEYRKNKCPYLNLKNFNFKKTQKHPKH